MNKKGRVMMMELLIFLVVVVLTSAIVLFLVQTGAVSVKGNQEPLLNAEFVPGARLGHLVIKEFNFCGAIDVKQTCLDERSQFRFGEDVNFRFVVDTSTSYGDIQIIENYRVKGPYGEILLDANAENNFHFEIQSDESQELVTMTDSFVVTSGSASGDYTLDLVIKNPLLNKETVLSKKFTIQ